MHHFYKTKITELETKYNALKAKSSQFSWLRLLLFVAFAASVYFLFKGSFTLLFVGLGLLFLVLFIALAIKHNTIELEIEFLNAKIQVNKDEMQYLNFDYNKRFSGAVFEKLNPFLTNDFNLVGQGSLFQYINRCKTAGGRELLAYNLCHLQKDIALISCKQLAIKELSNKIEFLQNFQAYNSAISESANDLRFLVGWAKNYSENNRILKTVATMMAVVNVLWITFSAFGLISWSSIFVPIILSQLLIHFNRKKAAHYNQINNNVVSANFEHYSKLLKLIDSESFDADEINTIKSRLLYSNRKASESLNQLFNILKVADIQENGLLSLLVNSVVFSDIQIHYYLNKWKKEHAEQIESWLMAVSEMEVLLSYAVYAFNNAEFVCFPVPSEEDFVLDATDLGHPLIKPEVRVNNSFCMQHSPSVQIITGANMAGKSTFLRTVAVNLILASNGAPVVARKFWFSPCDILSSIKVQDSLHKNESYFYAELLRLKEIVEHVNLNPQTVVILDEILRGTNTKDKQTGSLGILKKLIGLNAHVMIATHDLSIGELEKEFPLIAKNSCFEVEMNDDELFFDYKIKDGISQKLNASYLLKKMELID